MLFFVSVIALSQSSVQTWERLWDLFPCRFSTETLCRSHSLPLSKKSAAWDVPDKSINAEQRWSAVPFIPRESETEQVHADQTRVRVGTKE